MNTYLLQVGREEESRHRPLASLVTYSPLQVPTLHDIFEAYQQEAALASIYLVVYEVPEARPQRFLYTRASCQEAFQELLSK